MHKEDRNNIVELMMEANQDEPGYAEVKALNAQTWALISISAQLDELISALEQLNSIQNNKP